MNSKVIGVGIALALVAIVLVIIVTKPPAEAAGDTLIYARSADSSTLDPQEMQWGEDVKVSENIYETLVKFTDEPPKVAPNLAGGYHMVDKLTWEFHLRKNVKFHDGSDFNSDAVVLAINRLLDKEHPQKPKTAPYASFYRQTIKSVEAKDEHTVVFKLKQPSAVFLQLLAIFPAGIASPKAIKEHGEKFARNPSGTGPFLLNTWKRNQKIELVRNKNYWGQRPKLERIIFVPYPNPQTAVQSLKTGDIHMMDHATLADIKILRADPNTTVKLATSPNVCYLAFNMSAEATHYNNIHFRRAVAFAINRDELNSAVYYDLAKPARNIVPPTLWADIGEIEPYEYNLDKAKEELKKANLPADFVAELWHPNFGRDYMPEPEKVAEFIKDRCARIGLKVKLQTFEKAAYTKKTREKTHPMCLLGWMADYPDPDNFMNPLLHGDFAGDLNISFFNHPEFNRLVSLGASETDWEKRKSYYMQAVKIYREQKPSIALVHTQRVFALRKGVQFKPHAIDYRIYNASIAPK